MNIPEEYGFKITIIGDGAVGKTSLIKKFTKGTFERNYIKTIGAQYSRFDEKINDAMVNLIFWDIAGQDEFNFLKPIFYKGSKATIIVYSLENNKNGKDSFFHIEDWYKEIKKYCENIPVVLFANKVDLIEEKNINSQEIRKLVKHLNLKGYYITSAKTGQGVIDSFHAIIKELYNESKLNV
jgi:small GTP-binding protein